MRYNIGDTVVDVSNLSKWCSERDHEEAIDSIKQKTVVDANDQMFTVHSGLPVNKVDGQSNSIKRLVNSQRTGHPFYGESRTPVYWNLTTNGKALVEYVTALYRQELTSIQREDDAEIKELEDSIKMLQKQLVLAQDRLALVKAGNRETEDDYQVTKRDFIKARHNELLAKLNQ